METPITKTIEMRLVFQGSVPVDSTEYAEDTYNELKIFLQAIHPKITLNGQVIKMFEPCCRSTERRQNVQKSVPIP